MKGKITHLQFAETSLIYTLCFACGPIQKHVSFYFVVYCTFRGFLNIVNKNKRVMMKYVYIHQNPLF